MTAIPSRPVIVQVVRNFGVGEGVGGVAENLERHFVKAGYVCERITLRSTGIKRRRSRSRLVDKAFQLRDVIWFSTVGTLAVKWRQRKDDCIVITHNDPVAGDIFVNHGLLKKVMRDRHPGALAFPHNPMHWFTLWRDERRYGKRCPHRVVVSLTPSDDALLTTLYPRLAKPREVIINGIDLIRYEVPSEGRRASARRALDLLPQDHAVLFIGHEFERKGLWPTIEALALLPPRFKLLVVGGSEALIDQAEQRAAKAGVSDRIRFLGTQADPRPFLEAADSLVLATAYEAAPLVMLEALASGVPVVATATGLALELLNDLRPNGVVVEGIAAAISVGVQLMDENLQMDRSGVNLACRQSVESLSWESVTAKYIDLIDSLTADPYR